MNYHPLFLICLQTTTCLPYHPMKIVINSNRHIWPSYKRHYQSIWKQYIHTWSILHFEKCLSCLKMMESPIQRLSLILRPLRDWKESRWLVLLVAMIVSNVKVSLSYQIYIAVWFWVYSSSFILGKGFVHTSAAKHDKQPNIRCKSCNNCKGEFNCVLHVLRLMTDAICIL